MKSYRSFGVLLGLLLATAQVAAAPKASGDQRLDHWAYQPTQRPTVPSALAKHPVDAFVLARLAAKKLALSPEADRRTLIRRLSFDLLGLPPAPERVAQFINDPNPKAYEQLVDEFLASSHYGERWARHWLDIAHYADTHGFERDQLRPNAWRYRDYVIASLNADKPYDQFLREQIAGDVLAEKFRVQSSEFKVGNGSPAAPGQTTPRLRTQNPELVAATGFLAAGPWDFVGQVETKSEVLRRAARADDLDDMVTQVLTAAMGVTINCAPLPRSQARPHLAAQILRSLGGLRRREAR